MSTTALDAGGGRSASSSAFLVGLLGVAVILSYVDRGLLAVSGPLLKGELRISATEFGSRSPLSSGFMRRVSWSAAGWWTGSTPSACSAVASPRVE